jgi:hypothetical protein
MKLCKLKISFGTKICRYNEQKNKIYTKMVSNFTDIRDGNDRTYMKKDKMRRPSSSAPCAAPQAPAPCAAPQAPAPCAAPQHLDLRRVAACRGFATANLDVFVAPYVEKYPFSHLQASLHGKT